MIKVGMVGVVVGALFAPLCGHAQQKDHFSSSYAICIQQARQVDKADAICESKEADRQDATLNALYRQLASKLSVDQKSVLQNAERAWVSYRDARCTYEAFDERGGTLENVLLYACRKDMTYARVEDVRRYLSIESLLK